jgi:hypothetical protein
MELVKCNAQKTLQDYKQAEVEVSLVSIKCWDAFSGLLNDGQDGL